jgi:hypothetical protein
MIGPPWHQRLARKLDKTLASIFYIDQWVIMTAQGMPYDSLRWRDLRPLVPDKDRYWGDPFVVERHGRYYIFVEEKLYATGRGRIACLTLDAAGNLLAHQVVLERQYHVSYPFLFNHAGELFMMPETAGNRTIELYRCARFPNQWEPAVVLMRDIYAVDATLLEHEGRYWIFANLKEPGGSSLNSLHLFWAKSPVDQSWTPHPRNPVVLDIGSARPAGKLFHKDGELIRPSQDSSHRYGGALKFNRVVELDETSYQEEPIAEFLPRGGRIRATHTFNQAGGLTVIDAVVRRPK